MDASLHIQSTQVLPNRSMGFSAFDLDYWLMPNRFISLTGASDPFDQIDRRLINNAADAAKRQNLVECLLQQYATIGSSEAVLSNIRLLAEPNAYTVICAHQPCLLGGPGFWLYKIATTIALCRQLSLQYPSLHFIPVYFCGLEDHDFEEINHLHVFKNKLEWKQSTGTAVGRLDTHGLLPVLDSLGDLFRDNAFATSFLSAQRELIAQSASYGEYYLKFTDSLFGEFGLIPFNPDDPNCKAVLRPILRREISEGVIARSCKLGTEALQSLGYEPQVNPRELNLFYHHQSGRKRLIRLDEHHFSLADDSQKWTLAELLNEVETSPGQFSPNVLLRPIYQELLFPNVAFVGGGAEIHYFLQLSGTFKEFGIPLPAIFRRNSAFYADARLVQKMMRTGFSFAEFLMPLHELEQQHIGRKASEQPISESAFVKLRSALEDISQAAGGFDASTQTSIQAELHKIEKMIGHIEQRQTKFVKSQHENDLQQLRNIREQLFPGSTLQERHANFLPQYFRIGKTFIDELVKCFEGSPPQLLLLEEHN